MKKILLLTLGIFIFLLCSCGKNTETLSDAIEDEIAETKHIEAFGIIKAENIINITIPATALVEKINVKEGQRIKKDEVIMTLDWRFFNGMVTEKQIELNGLNARGNVLKDELEKEWEDRPETLKFERDMEYANTQYNDAVNEKDKQKVLLDAGCISPREYEEFEKLVEARKKILDDLSIEEEQARYLFNESKIKTESELKSLESSKRSIETSINILNNSINMDFIKENDIISTLDNGMIFDIECTAGDIITEGKKVVSLLDMDSLYIEANVNEEFIRDVKLGAKTLIIPEADKNKEYKGRVFSISEGAFNINGQTVVPVHIKITDKDDFIKPNFNVDIEILIE